MPRQTFSFPLSFSIIQLVKAGEYEKEQLLSFEKEVTGFYLSGHPFYILQWMDIVPKVLLEFHQMELTLVKLILLVFPPEKEVTGFYLSGHPLEEQQEMLKKNITKTTLDFAVSEDTGNALVEDGEIEIIGGMIIEMHPILFY